MTIQGAIARKTLIAMIASIGLAAAATPSFADSATDNPSMMGGYGPGYGPGYGMGPGMMGGYGPGYARGYGPAYGMGPGMMGGYGPGNGMGPGMMGGYGMGPGMMGGYGMGPGMMGGYGQGYGMGPGMMGGCGGGYGYNALNLSDAQRDKIAKIEQETARSQWEIMSKMREAAIQGAVEAQKQIDAVLTKEQREQLKRGWGAPR